ncbi:MAG: hypothetical protein ACOC2H_05410 [Spirochaetota bacterium]
MPIMLRILFAVLCMFLVISCDITTDDDSDDSPATEEDVNNDSEEAEDFVITEESLEGTWEFVSVVTLDGTELTKEELGDAWFYYLYVNFSDSVYTEYEYDDETGSVTYCSAFSSYSFTIEEDGAAVEDTYSVTSSGEFILINSLDDDIAYKYKKADDTVLSDATESCRK